MMTAMLHSNGQLRTEKDGDTEKGCQKPAVQQNTADDGYPAIFYFVWFDRVWWTSRHAVECNPGQVVINTHVPLSPSSIIWYQPMGGDALQLGR